MRERKKEGEKQPNNSSNGNDDGSKLHNKCNYSREERNLNESPVRSMKYACSVSAVSKLKLIAVCKNSIGQFMCDE